MIPVLYNSDEKEFANNGLGGLPDAISCLVTEERNTAGGYYLTMEYPVSGVHFDDIQTDRIIYAAPAPKKTPQPFRISRIEKEGNIVRIEAPHISNDLKNYVSWLSQTGSTPQGMIYNFFWRARQIGQTVDFWLTTDVTHEGSITFNHPEPKSLLEILLNSEGSVLDVLGGEYEWDGWHIILHAQRGVERDIEVRYGVNIIGMSSETDTAELVTAVYPYYMGMQNEQDVFVYGDLCVAGNASEFEITHAIPLDVSEEFDNLAEGTLPTAAQVTAKGQAFVNSSKANILESSVTIDYFPLVDRDIYLCDTVKVVYPQFGIDTTAKVVKTVHDVMRDRYDSITIGAIRMNIVDVIANMLKKKKG